MKEEACEQNRNENVIKHRILSWCGEHKMQTYLAVILTLAVLSGYAYVLSQESHVEIDPKWTGGDAVLYHPDYPEKMVEVSSNTPAQLTVEVTTDRPGNLSMKCVPILSNTDILFSQDELNWTESIFLMPQPFYYPGSVTVEIWMKTPYEEGVYAYQIDFSAQLDSYPEEHIRVWLKVKEPAPETETPPQTTSPPSDLEKAKTLLKENPWVIILIIMGIAYLFFRRH